jgi:hypothetical protein
MASRIKISTGEISLEATLTESLTAAKILEALPLEGNANRWGDEIYFSIPVRVGEAEDARQDMAVGELGYWPSGSAFCIFFGPTPVSAGEVPRAYSNVNPFGQLDDDASLLKKVQDGEVVKIERIDG